MLIIELAVLAFVVFSCVYVIRDFRRWDRERTEWLAYRARLREAFREPENGEWSNDRWTA